MRRGALCWGLGLMVLTAAAPAGLSGQVGRVSVALSNTAIVFPDPAFAHFDTGWIDHPGIVVSVTARPSQVAWELRIRADDPTLGGYGKAVSDLLWRLEGSTAWVPLSGSDAVVLEGVGDQQLTLYFRTYLDWDRDLPDSYGTGLTFTIVRP